jgi:GTP-binding protein HflX
MVQRLDHPSASYYVGEGKLKELAALKSRYDLVIFDDELSPSQQRNLEDALKIKVIDRTALILDIFGRRAKTREGQLQVELAQHQYLLPRLAGQWSHLERLGGGIGTRGPGESQIETDRRLIHDRIKRLKARIDRVRQHRGLYRRQHQKSGIAVVSLVGYTNAGKSTLFNALSHADVLVEDKLFATLDPTTRRIMLPDKRQVLLTDTVGFIQKLPLTVVAAFRATLEELDEADLLIHVVDITHPNAVQQSHSVEQTLQALGLANKPITTALNKIDMLPATDGIGSCQEAEAHDRQYADDIAEGLVLISALKCWGFTQLLDQIATKLDELSRLKTAAN